MKKLLPLLALIALAILLCVAKSHAQCQTFTLLRLTDADGTENRNETTTLCLLAGFVEVTEAGTTWKEEISLQSKGQGYVTAETPAGEYTFIFSEGVVTAVYLRSQIGADRSYLNPKK